MQEIISLPRNPMKISIAVCTHNEGQYIDYLLERLVKETAAASGEFEIVVVDDNSTDDAVLTAFSKYADKISVYHHQLNRDFATHKNFMNSKCSGEWIFNLDADELPPSDLIENIHAILLANSHIDAFWLPRVNIVDGVTDEHIRIWGWRIQDTDHQYKTENSAFEKKKKINWPDWQLRIYKNLPSIKWEGKVHEQLTGHDVFSQFPADEEYAILHSKHIDRQVAQNSFYDTIHR